MNLPATSMPFIVRPHLRPLFQQARPLGKTLLRVKPAFPRSLPHRSLVSNASTYDGGGGKKGGNGGHKSNRKYYPLALIPAVIAIPAFATSEPSSVDEDALHAIPTSDLLRSWLVWTLISLPGLVDYSPSLLSALFQSPLRAPTEWFVRNTFFAQFVPGETVEECFPALQALRKRNIGVLLNYSAEVDEGALKETSSEKLAREKKEREVRLEQVLFGLNKMGEYEKALPLEQRGCSGFALKITGLIDPEILRRASYSLMRLRPLLSSNSPSSPRSLPFVPYPGTPMSADRQIVARTPDLGLGDGREILALKGQWDAMGIMESDQGLREGDLEELRLLWDKLVKVGKVARDNHVTVVIDAEHTWYQPALDAYTLLLSEEFNRPPKTPSSATPWTGPLIYGTYQSYLRRQPSHLVAALAHAEQNGYALGIKCVRGAYSVQERNKWADEKRHGADPIWENKDATDASYNGSIGLILGTLAQQLNGPRPELALSVTFGTHNAASTDLICKTLQSTKLATPTPSGKLSLDPAVRGKVHVAQLYGMRDDLTDAVGSRFVNDGLPVSLKYIAYGRLKEVMPFLGRRAVENKSLMSGDHGAGSERRRIGKELRRRVWE